MRPAAAVIPAPIAYIKAVAVKKLVVGSRGEMSTVRRKLDEYRFVRPLLPVPHLLPLTRSEDATRGHPAKSTCCLSCVASATSLFSIFRDRERVEVPSSVSVGLLSRGSGSFTLKKLECSKQALNFVAVEYISMRYYLRAKKFFIFYLIKKNKKLVANN